MIDTDINNDDKEPARDYSAIAVAGVDTELSFKDRMELLCHELVNKGILFAEAVEQFESCFIAEVLERHNGNLIKTAAALGIHRNTLSKKVNARLMR